MRGWVTVGTNKNGRNGEGWGMREEKGGTERKRKGRCEASEKCVMQKKTKKREERASARNNKIERGEKIGQT